MSQDNLLYKEKKQNTQVPSFVTTAHTNRNFQSLSQRNAGSMRVTKDIKHFTSIESRIGTANNGLNALNCKWQPYTINKFKSECSDFITNTNQFEYLKLCNTNLLDLQLTKTKIKPKYESTVEIVPLFEKVRPRPKRFTIKSKKESFTLSHMRIHSYDHQYVEQNINNNLIDSQPKLVKPESPVQKEPQFDRYVTKEPIRRYDMVYNVNQLIRLQEKREKEFQKKKANDPEYQLEIIKRKNQIQMLLTNTEKLESLKKESGGILSYIKQSDQIQENVVQGFKNHLQID